MNRLWLNHSGELILCNNGMFSLAKECPCVHNSVCTAVHCIHGEDGLNELGTGDCVITYTFKITGPEESTCAPVVKINYANYRLLQEVCPTDDTMSSTDREYEGEVMEIAAANDTLTLTHTIPNVDDATGSTFYWSAYAEVSFDFTDCNVEDMAEEVEKWQFKLESTKYNEDTAAEPFIEITKPTSTDTQTVLLDTITCKSVCEFIPSDDYWRETVASGTTHIIATVKNNHSKKRKLYAFGVADDILYVNGGTVMGTAYDGDGYYPHSYSGVYLCDVDADSSVDIQVLNSYPNAVTDIGWSGYFMLCDGEAYQQPTATTIEDDFE